MSVFTDEELQAWAPPERISVSDWAERFRRIVSKDASEPGPWRNSRAPYLKGIMDSLCDDNYDVVVIRKAARVGGSEAARNALAWWIDQDPGPVLLVYPSQASAEEQIRNEIVPLIQGCPKLKPYMTGSIRDWRKGEIELTRCRIYVGYSSPQSLASRTIRYVIFDESDKMPIWAGKEGDPLSLAYRRLQTFGYRKKLVVTSTPTVRTGVISRAFDECVDRRHYHVPCVHCGELQALTFDQLKWPKYPDLTHRAQAARIEAERSAWYECSSCGEKMVDADKAKFLPLGVWVSEGCEPGVRPESRRVAFQISALYSQLGITWHEIASQWLLAQGSLPGKMEFITQILGQPFEEQISALTKGDFHSRGAKGHEPGVVPAWGGMLLAAADTQQDCWGGEGV